MCQCSPAETMTERPALRRSVFVQGEAEALAFKWILSQEHGYDVGQNAITRWVREHWHGFLRQRWLEHLQGHTFWIELDHDDFGLLTREFRGSLLIDEVLWRLRNGWENLDVLNWGIEEDFNMDDLVQMLEMLNINERRLECQFAARLAHNR